ncbi:hypothetical protein [Nocardioides bizhenqiangii]|uniref:Uncharacterized protein n=1 Tax=Nocardioides bizhenqiangii TaxID=3095076 RepID=A0ABZ0ZTF7_9ACTN|nr:hypothetical protein [Nocardioides sp. HM61]WQQ27345.1 hypothetical protein SHK19_03745 [Nocardioides sp. HM61]
MAMQTPNGMDGPFAWDPSPEGGLGELVGRRVTQCALSRICGVCAESLGRPVAFVGTPDEVGRNAFHAPPLHSACADALLRDPGADPDWEVVATAGFEFVRPAREDEDRRPTFQPNSLLGASSAVE